MKFCYQSTRCPYSTTVDYSQLQRSSEIKIWKKRNWFLYKFHQQIEWEFRSGAVITKVSYLTSKSCQSEALSLNDYHPVALTSVHWVVSQNITSFLLNSLDPLQFAYRPNRSTDDTISLALHTALSHLDQSNTYVKMLLIDYNSAFITVVSPKHIIKLRGLGLSCPLCSWVLDFLTFRPSPDTGAVCSAPLYTPCSHDCTAQTSSLSRWRYYRHHEMSCIEEVRVLTSWYHDNNLPQRQ